MSAPSADVIAQLRRVAESGRDPDRWARYIAALLRAGQKGRARKVAKSAPLSGEAKKNLVAMADKGVAPGGAPLQELAALIRASKFAEARALGRDLLKRHPKDARLLNVLGVLALSTDEPVEAEIVLRRALEYDAANDDARSNLGVALVRQGRGRAAIEVLEPLTSRPDAPLNARVNLASAYLRAENPERALDLTVDILKDHPKDPETLALRAQAHLALGQGEAALETLKPLQETPGFDLQDLVADALERTEGRATALRYVEESKDLPRPTQKRIASLLGEWGELDVARNRARALADTAPEDPTGFRLLGLYGRWAPGDPAIVEMRAGLENKTLPAAQRGSFGLALAKAYMDTEEHELAFGALLRGNACLRSLVDYDVKSDLARFDRVRTEWTAAVIQQLIGVDTPAIAPVFIVGLPRSGSTLIETVLSRHPAVMPLGESPRAFAAVRQEKNAAKPEAIAGIRRAVAGYLTAPAPREVVTDKLLANFQHLGALAAAFPKARFIEARRDLRATALSIFQTELGPAAHPYAMQLEDLAHYCIGYTRLMNHWAHALGDRLYRADYESLVARPGDEIPKLVSASGLPWDPACLGQTAPERRINTFSVAQARKPITTASVARWTRYEEGLAPLIDILKKEGLIDG